MYLINRLEPRTKDKFCLILLSLSILLFLYNILSISPVLVSANDFLGLTSHLTFSYWVGLILLVFCCLMAYIGNGNRGEPIYLLLLFVVGLYLFGLGVFSEENARAWSSYYPIGEAKTILESGRIGSANGYSLISYRSWPAVHMISAYLIYLTNVRLELITRHMPLFWIISFIPITYSIGKRITKNNNKAFILSLLACSSFFQVYYYYSPQSLGYLLFLMLFFIIMALRASPISNALILVPFLTLVVTHLLYCVLFIASSLIPLLHKRKFGAILLFLLVFGFWYLYFAPDPFSLGIKKMVALSLQLDLALSSQYDKFGFESPSVSYLKLINAFRFGYLAIYAAILSLAVFSYRHLNTIDKITFRNCLYWIIILPLFGLINYGSESFERIYLFSIVPALCIITLSLSNKKVMSIIFVLFIFLHIPAHYGTEAFLMTRTSELSGSEFFSSRVYIDSFETQPPSYYLYFIGGQRYICFYNPEFINVETKTPAYFSMKNNHELPKDLRYILKGLHGDYYSQIYGKTDLINGAFSDNQLIKTTSLIYNNQGLKTFYHIF